MRQQRVKRRFAGLLTTTLALFGAHVAMAQGSDFGQLNTAANFGIPEEFTVFSERDPNVRRPTAIVNGDVVTRTDVEHRLALFLASNPAVEISDEDMRMLRMRVLRNLIDETLQIQEALANEIEIPSAEIAQTFTRVAERSDATPQEFSAYLREQGSSDGSMMRQIQGELSWNRLLRRNVNPFVSISDSEVEAFIESRESLRGQTEYRVAEIFMAATPANEAQVRANIDSIRAQLTQGASFAAFARQYSDATHAAVGGDLGWVRPSQLPEILAQVVSQIPIGALSNPIPVPGGFSLIAVADQRQVLTANARNAVLSLKQITINFPEGTVAAQAEPRLAALTAAVARGGGCGTADAVAAEAGGDVVQNDNVTLGDLPQQLQQVIGNLQIGQASPPFGSLSDGVRILILCGRDDPPAQTEMDQEQVAARMEEGRVNRRAQRYLQDLRRDAVIEYR